MSLSHLFTHKRGRLAIAHLALVALLVPAPGSAASPTAAIPGAKPDAEPAVTLDAPELLIADNASSFVLDGNMLLWSKFDDSCTGSDVRNSCFVRSQPASGGVRRTLFENPGAAWRFGVPLAADGSYVYWVYQGQVVRVPRNAAASSTAQAVAARQTTGASVQEVAVDSAYVFWAEIVAAPAPGSNRSFVFRQPKNGGAVEPMGQYPASISRLKADGNGGVYFLDGAFNGVLGHAFPNAGGFATEYTLATGVQAYTFDATTLYWADASAGVRIRSAPRTAMTGDPATVYTLPAGGTPEVRSLAVDGQNLYWHEQRSAAGGPIQRLSLRGGSPQPLTDNLLDAEGLVSNGRFLYYLEAFNLFRLPTAATPVQLDLLADEFTMEIVQTIQRPANDVPLVAGKETYVRVHGRIGLSSAGLSELAIAPAVRLVGTRGGAPLPGSPLLPVTSNPLRSTPVDRTTLAQGSLFRLPPSWTQGTVELRAELNPNRVVAETTYANNSVTKTAVFLPKRPICLDMIPVATKAGTIASWTPGREQHMVRGASLLPQAAFRQVWQGGPPHRRPTLPRIIDPLGVFGSGLYGLDTDADMGYLLFNMTFDYIVRSLTTDCFAVAMVPGAARFGMSAGEASPVFFFLENYSGDPRNMPRGGTAGLAHELSHSLGRAHVACPASGPGAPAFPDPGYPYPSCQLDNVGSTQHIGFDVLTRRLVLPTDGGDLMSYSFMTWTSDYTYRALFSRIRNATLVEAGQVQPALAAAPEPAAMPAAMPAAGPAAEPQLLASGLISATAAGEVGIVNFSYAVAAQASAAAKIGETTEPDGAYELHLLDAAGNVLRAVPLNVAVTEAEGGTPMKLFFNLIDPVPAAVRLEVVKGGAGAIGSRTAGPAAPTITITSPAAGSSVRSELVITWNASDADGDPLMYSLRYSPDNGTTWIPLGAPVSENRLVVDMDGGLPGGGQALVQVVASDGLHSTAATAGPFAVQRHPPRAAILNDDVAGLNAANGAGADQHETVVLRGRGYDAEDGQLAGAALQWTVTGPVTRRGEGEQLILLGLPPGIYTVQLAATDSDNEVGQAATQLTIAPKRIFDGGEPVLDGLCADDAYAADTDPLTLRYADGLVAAARFVHAGDFLYACLAGMPVGAEAGSFAGLRFDLDNSGGATPAPGDLGFFVGRDGVPLTVHGAGAGGFVSDAQPQGLQAAVSQSEDGAYWNAELRIDAGRLGPWNSLVRMRAAHSGRNAGGDDTAWPVESAGNAPGSWGLTALGQLAQRIDFAPLADRALGDGPFALAAAASSGLPVTYTSLAPAVCTVAEGLVTLISAGVCTIEAAQGGSAAYAAAGSVQRSFTVRPQPQSLYLPAIRR